MMLGLLLAVAWFEAPQEIALQARAGKPYAQAFREVIGSLDDAAAALAVRGITDRPTLVAEDDARRYVKRTCASARSAAWSCGRRTRLRSSPPCSN